MIKRKERLQKEPHRKYYNLSNEKEDKRRKKIRERCRNLSAEQNKSRS